MVSRTFGDFIRNVRSRLILKYSLTIGFTKLNILSYVLGLVSFVKRQASASLQLRKLFNPILVCQHHICHQNRQDKYWYVSTVLAANKVQPKSWQRSKPYLLMGLQLAVALVWENVAMVLWSWFYPNKHGTVGFTPMKSRQWCNGISKTDNP